MLDGRQQLAMLKPSVFTADEEKAHSEAFGVLVGARVENYGAMYRGEEVFNDGDQVVARRCSGFLATALKSVRPTYGYNICSPRGMPDEGVTLDLDNRRWKIQYLCEQREKLRIKLETRRDPLMMVTIFIEVMCLEEAFEVLDDVISRDEVAGIILRMRLYMRDAGVIGDECTIANLIDMPANFKEDWW